MDNLFIPNSTQIPNVFLDEIMPLLTGEELKVLLYAIRHIIGFQDRITTRTRHISLSMFQNGYGKYQGCGLGKNAIIKALAELKKYRLLIAIGEPTAAGQAWRIADVSDNPDLDGLQNRFLARQTNNQRRTQKARAVVNHISESANNADEVVCHTDQQAVCHTNQTWFVTQTRRGLSDKHKEIIPSNTLSKRESHTPEKTDTTTPTVGNIIQAWLTGIKATSSAKAWGEYNRMIAQDMLDAGIIPVDVTAFLSSPFWVGKTPTLQKVAEQIGGWKASQSPTPMPVVKSSLTPEQQFMAQLLREEQGT